MINKETKWIVVNTKYKMYLVLPKMGEWQNDLWKVYKFLTNYYGELIHFVPNSESEYDEIINDPEFKDYNKMFCTLKEYDKEGMEYVEIIQHDILHSAWWLSRKLQQEKDRRYNELLKEEVHKV